MDEDWVQVTKGEADDAACGFVKYLGNRKELARFLAPRAPCLLSDVV